MREHEQIVDALKRGEDGATVVFEGIVRNQTRGRRTLFLDYEAYEPMAIDKPMWQFVVRCLLERGWRIAVDREKSELWFFAPETEEACRRRPRHPLKRPPGLACG